MFICLMRMKKGTWRQIRDIMGVVGGVEIRNSVKIYSNKDNSCLYI